MSMSMRMRMMTIGIMTALVLLIGGSFVPPAIHAATTFIGSIIEGVDQSHQTITFRTREGQSWTLGIADPDLLKKEPIAKGDHVSIEIDPKNDKVVKIVRVTDQPQAEQTRIDRPQPTE